MLVKRLYIFLLIFFISAFILVSSFRVYAAPSDCVPACSPTQQCTQSYGVWRCVETSYNPLPESPAEPAVPPISFSDLLGSVGAILYPLGIGIGLFFIIKAGYEFMTSEGEPQKVKAAQEDLTSAVVGLIFIVLSTVILNIIINSLIGG